MADCAHLEMALVPSIDSHPVVGLTNSMTCELTQPTHPSLHLSTAEIVAESSYADMSLAPATILFVVLLVSRIVAPRAAHPSKAQEVLELVF